MPSRNPSLPILVLYLLVLTAQPASGHLCLIRQGAESGGQPELNNHYGTSLAAGDFNGDSFEDLATGAPNDGQGDPFPGLHGALTVNFGSRFGLTHVGAQYITIGDLPDIDVRFGQSLAVGDFNNDTYDDLAVGAPRVDKLAVSDAGGVLIYMGGPLGLPNTASITFDQEDIGLVSETDDRWGWALCSGDFNGDGFADLGVGAIGEDLELGSVSALYGSGAGLTAAGAQSFTFAQVGGLPAGAPKFGWALTSGNVADTVHDELIASAPYEEVQLAGAGRVYAIPGSGSGLDVNGTIIIDGTISGDPLTTPGPNEFGYSLAVGNFPHGAPNYAELIVGEPGWDDGIKESAGRVVVGSIDPSAQDSSWVVLTVKSTLQTARAEDRFGTAVAAAPYNNLGWDDVAASAPGTDFTFSPGPTDDAGRVYVFSTDPAGLGLGQFDLFNPRVLNDKQLEFASQIGQSLTFGYFDEFGLPNLAIGAPDKDFDVWVADQGPNIGDAGQVYVVAPWRQVQDLRSRTAIAINCEGEIVFSQRPFARVPIASVTKTMTGLLACEEVAAGYDSSLVHISPEWLKQENLFCNCWPFVEGQQTKFMDLVRITMGNSSNDASYAVADMLTGPLVWISRDSTTMDFVDDMNQKAAQLEMFRTLYSNPAGYDDLHHTLRLRPYSTAYDQSLLAEATMGNTCLRELVATDSWVVPTFYPAGTLFPNAQLVGLALTNGFKTAFEIRHPNAVGIKGGSLTSSLRTAQYAVLNTQGSGQGYVVGAAFGFDTQAKRYTAGAALMNLALAQCEDGDSIPLPPSPPEDDPVNVFPGISTCDTVITRVDAALTDATYNPVALTILPEAVTNFPVDLWLRMFRQTLFEIKAGEIVGLSLDRFRNSMGWKITNAGEETAELLILLGTPTPITLAPGETHTLPGPASILEVSESFAIQNTGMGTTNTIQLDMQERWLPLSIVDSADRQDISFGRTGDPFVDDIQIFIEGKDPECTNTVGVSVNAGDPSPIAVEETPIPLPDGLTIGKLLGSHPNPATDGSTIRFELARPAMVRLEIFDLAGRRVRSLIPHSIRAAGEHRELWDGLNTVGSRVPAGVYFVYLEVEGFRDADRIVLLD